MDEDPTQHPDTQAVADATEKLWQSILDELGWLEYPVRFILWCMKKLKLD